MAASLASGKTPRHHGVAGAEWETHGKAFIACLRAACLDAMNRNVYLILPQYVVFKLSGVRARAYSVGNDHTFSRVATVADMVAQTFDGEVYSS